MFTARFEESSGGSPSATWRCLTSFLCTLLPASSGLAAITIEGVTDKKVYADRRHIHGSLGGGLRFYGDA